MRQGGGSDEDDETEPGPELGIPERVGVEASTNTAPARNRRRKQGLHKRQMSLGGVLRLILFRQGGRLSLAVGFRLYLRPRPSAFATLLTAGTLVPAFSPPPTPPLASKPAAASVSRMNGTKSLHALARQSAAHSRAKRAADSQRRRGGSHLHHPVLVGGEDVRGAKLGTGNGYEEWGGIEYKLRTEVVATLLQIECTPAIFGFLWYSSTRFADSSSIVFWCKIADMQDPHFSTRSFRKLIDQTILPVLMRSRGRLRRRLGEDFIFTSYEYILRSDYGTADFLILEFLDVHRRPALSAHIYPPSTGLSSVFTLYPQGCPPVELNQDEGFYGVVVEAN
ncbi:hypothetical protein GALMADRAFT_216900 [Galerina marginata CBS 339.88]|uniref:Uncharacterized protein n=1 Tax=Galerina marginata (strain CBS 339.88) TaxID=685588 RepID=A0A067SIU1_GALM3|nr:hypothetical protein GALMADRAFT_216900 [Galerina marginata CBS 339.88]